MVAIIDTDLVERHGGHGFFDTLLTITTARDLIL